MIKGPKSGRCQLHGDRARAGRAKDLMLILVFAFFTQPYQRFYCLQAQCKLPLLSESDTGQMCLRSNSSAEKLIRAPVNNDSKRYLFNSSHLWFQVLLKYWQEYVKTTKHLQNHLAKRLGMGHPSPFWIIPNF